MPFPRYLQLQHFFLACLLTLSLSPSRLLALRLNKHKINSTSDVGVPGVEPKFTLLGIQTEQQKSNNRQSRGRCGSGPLTSVLMMSTVDNNFTNKTANDAGARNIERFLTTTRRLLQHFPWIAKIDVTLSSTQRRVCAAALVGPNTAITAAQCFYSGPEGVAGDRVRSNSAIAKRSQITFFLDEPARPAASTTSPKALLQDDTGKQDPHSQILGSLIRGLDNYTVFTRPLRDVFIHPTANLAIVRFRIPPKILGLTRAIQFLCLPKNGNQSAFNAVGSAHDSPWLAASSFFVSLMPSAPTRQQPEVDLTSANTFIDSSQYRPPLLFAGVDNNKTHNFNGNTPFVNFDTQLAYKLVNLSPYALLEPMGDTQCALVMAIATGAPPSKYLRDKKCFTNAATGDAESNSTKNRPSGVSGLQSSAAPTSTLLQPRLCADVDIGVPLVRQVAGTWTLFGILSETVKCPSTFVGNVPELPGVVQVSDVSFIRDELKPTLFTDLTHYRRWIEDQMAF